MEHHPTNPFEIFEIITHLGANIRLWKWKRYFVDSDDFTYRPKKLLPLCMVSRTWRAALLPIMWRIYDGTHMYSIPNDVISKYSHHFRYFFGCSHLGPFHITMLHALQISHFDDKIFQLPRTTTLSTLMWMGSGFMHFPLVLDLSESTYSELGSEEEIGEEEKKEEKEEEQEEEEVEEEPQHQHQHQQKVFFIAENSTEVVNENEQPKRKMRPLLSTMPTSITQLELKLWIIPDELEFLIFLTRFDRLSTLILFRVFDFNCFPTSPSLPPSVTTSITTPDVPVLLPNIKFLRLDFMDQRSDALLEIVKCCPNLEILEIRGSWASSRDMYETMVLYPYCPNLSSLSIRLDWYYSSDAQCTDYNPNDKDLSDLIFNLTGRRGGSEGPRTGQMRVIKVVLKKFGEEAAYAIAAQTDSLEILEMEIGCIFKYQSTPCDDDEYDVYDWYDDDPDDQRPTAIATATEAIAAAAVQEETNANALMRHLHFALTKLNRLRKLSLIHWYDEKAEDDGHHLLFSREPWACLETLEELDLKHIGSWGHAARVPEDVEAEDDRGGGIWVWRAEGSVQMSKEVENLIFEQVKRMPRLRRLSLCDTRYLKIKIKKIGQ